MFLNLFRHNQWITMNIIDMRVINTNGSNCTQNTLNISFDGVNSLISVVLMNQSNDKNTPDVEAILLIGSTIPLITLGYLNLNENAKAISWK